MESLRRFLEREKSVCCKFLGFFFSEILFSDLWGGGGDPDVVFAKSTPTHKHRLSSSSCVHVGILQCPSVCACRLGSSCAGLSPGVGCFISSANPPFHIQVKTAGGRKSGFGGGRPAGGKSYRGNGRDDHARVLCVHWTRAAMGSFCRPRHRVRGVGMTETHHHTPEPPRFVRDT